MTLETTLLQWIVNQGVAVGVLIFVLLRLDSKIDKLVVAIEKLADKMVV